MSRRQFLELCCDQCGIVCKYEWLSIGETDSGKMTIDPYEMSRKAGWTTAAISEPMPSASRMSASSGSLA